MTNNGDDTQQSSLNRVAFAAITWVVTQGCVTAAQLKRLIGIRPSFIKGQSQKNFVRQNLCPRNDITVSKTGIGRGKREEGVEGKKRERVAGKH